MKELLVFVVFFIYGLTSIILYLLGKDFIDNMEYKRYKKLYLELNDEFSKRYGSIREFTESMRPYSDSTTVVASLCLQQGLSVEFDSSYEDKVLEVLERFNIKVVDINTRCYSLGDGYSVEFTLERDLSEVM
eukprot:GHVR01131217.1.p1 GENE.GHVR01131217.1~~GHVR01131217.1.p1  ORF type:complete len:132 (-),score=0.66 GHVR01131217.1:427-822(-)